MAGRAMVMMLRRDMFWGGGGMLTGDVARARVPGDPAGAGDLFLSGVPVYLMALPEKVIVRQATTNTAGAVTFQWVREEVEFAVFTRARPLPGGGFAIGDYWDRLFARPML